MELILGRIENVSEIADKFISLVENKKKFAFYGEMGVGKTTFIKALCKQLGVNQVVTSPTFALINEYRTSDQKLIYHFDLYRINKVEELFDFGFEDYMYSDHFCFIEWPEKAEFVLPADITKVFITELPVGSRKIEIK